MHTQVLVSCGAYSILSHAIQGFVQEGDEVHMFEFIFLSICMYHPSILRLGTLVALHFAGLDRPTRLSRQWDGFLSF